MATYEYSGYKTDGTSCRGRVESGSTKQASRQLLETGVFVEHIRPLRVALELRTSRRSSLYRELGALLGAGLPLDRAISLMMESDDVVVSAVLSSVGSKIREGGSLADSLYEVCHGISGYERAALTSAERSATLPSMLSRLAELLDAQEGVRDQMRSALVYPSFILCLGLLVGGIMMGIVVPKTMAMLASSGMELPRVSTILINLSKFVAVVFAGLTVFGVCLSAVALRLSRRDEAVAVRIDEFLLRLPFMKPARGLAGMRFASILSVLSESGMPIVSALPIAGAGTGHLWLEKCVAEQTEKVRNGMSLSQAVGDLPMFGRELAEWVRVGEAGGCISSMLDVASERLQRDWDRALTRRLALLEPAILTLVGIFVLVMALALILPVVGMTKSLGVG